MKMKKILAAIAACAMSAAMIGMTAFASPVEGEDDNIPEDPVEVEEFEEPVEPEEPEEPAEPDPEPEPEPEPVKESPKTGNSPVALAVIPVALAAAAVVAKKAK